MMTATMNIIIVEDLIYNLLIPIHELLGTCSSLLISFEDDYNSIIK